MDHIESILTAVALAVGIILYWRRRSATHEAILRPLVEQHGLEFVVSKSPSPFRTGPFPKFAVKFGGMQTKVLGVSGEYWTYRIVSVRTPDGSVRETWAQLYFQAFKFNEIEWLPTLESLAHPT